jgi:hypothetical protein
MENEMISDPDDRFGISMRLGGAMRTYDRSEGESVRYAPIKVVHLAPSRSPNRTIRSAIGC